MKTSEFIEKAKKYGIVSETHSDIRVEQLTFVIASVYKFGVFDFLIDTTCPPELAHLIIDYANTPLNEREEEKKYWLLMPDNFNHCFKYYLNHVVKKDTWIMTGNTEVNGCQVKFTQAEIDAMPFDTNFFTKVEVK